MKEKDFQFWIEHNLNIIFRGKAGCGKTARIIEALESRNIKYKYFSASTIDPWIDFVGIPKETVDENGRSYISFIRPKEIEYDEVEVIVLDEYNRASKKVLNATMELIQFKTINGKKLGKLRFIWAAVNINEGDEDTYSVEKIDPAQLDRFQVHVDVPYELDKSYFKKKFGEDVFLAANEWWKSLSDKMRDQVSPRRVDYALDTWKSNGNVAYILPKGANPFDLINRLSTGSYEKLFDSLVADNDSEKWKNSLLDINFSDWIFKNYTKSKIAHNLIMCLPYCRDELVSSIIQEKSKDTKFLEEIYVDSRMKDILIQIVNAKTAARRIVKNLTSFYNSKMPNNTIVKMPSDMIKQYNAIHKHLSLTQSRRKEAISLHSSISSASMTADSLINIILTMFAIKKRSTRYSFRTMFPAMGMDGAILKGHLSNLIPANSIEYKVLMSQIIECENY